MPPQRGSIPRKALDDYGRGARTQIRMTGARLRLTTSGALKERRLSELLAGRDASSAALLDVVRDAQVLGSLQLSGFDFAWEQVRASSRGEPAKAPLAGLQRAMNAVDPQAPLSLAALLVWHTAAIGASAGLRTEERSRAWGPPPAPAAFVRSRLAILEDWLDTASVRGLQPAQVGALVLARLVELQPFDAANGRVSRLAASHLMVRAGARPPVLVGGDKPRLEAALAAAFRFDTEPLGALLQESSERALDVMIQSLQAEAQGL